MCNVYAICHVYSSCNIKLSKVSAIVTSQFRDFVSKEEEEEEKKKLKKLCTKTNLTLLFETKSPIANVCVLLLLNYA